MTVHELLAAFNRSRGSLSSRRLSLAARGITTHVGSDGDSVNQPAKPQRTRKPIPCKCSCNTGESAKRECENLDPCGHKGCGLAARGA